MKPSSRGGRGAHHGRRNSPPTTPYSQPQPQGGGSNTRTTRSRSISQGLARPDVLVTSGQPTQLTLPSLPASNLPVWHRNWIRQILYVPARTRGDFTPADPVSFSVNRVPGVSLSQAVAGEYAGLTGAYDRISSFGSSKAIFRIQFVGRHPYASKVNTRHHNAAWEPIMRCKLAKEVGRRVKAYIEEQGLQRTLTFDRIYLTHLIHVSKGSWQPELWYEDIASTLSPSFHYTRLYTMGFVNRSTSGKCANRHNGASHGPHDRVFHSLDFTTLD